MKDIKNRAQYSYYCTWCAQGYLTENGACRTQGTRTPRNMLNAEIVFGNGGMAHSYENIRSELIFVFDDGWDVPYEYDHDKEAFGSLIVDADRFPFATGDPAERLKALSDRIKSLGWKGVGIWVAAQRCGKEGQSPFCDADKEYWRERILWSKYAGIAYWKIDWGKNEHNNVFRKFLTETAAELYPDLVMEQAICIPPFNGADHNEARVLERFAENKKLNDLSIAATDFSEVFRTYDVSPPLSVATTLDRAAGLLPTARGYLNVEDELYIGAALGCQVGIMRSAFGKGADAWDDSDRLREADAAVAWQKIAPPFVGGTSKTSDEILTDEYEFGKGEMWFDKVNGKNIRQSAPASVARNCELPNITAGESGYKPFVAAARNPAGAYSVAVLPRTVKGIKRKYVGGEVRCKSVAATDKIALFGTAERVVFELDKKITRVMARSLFGGAPTDISHSILSSRNGFAVDEKTVNALNNADDRSAPAIIFEVQ